MTFNNFSLNTSSIPRKTDSGTQSADKNTTKAVKHEPCVLSGLLQGASHITFEDVNAWVVEGLANKERPCVIFRLPADIDQRKATEEFQNLGGVNEIKTEQTSDHPGWPRGTYDWLNVSVQITNLDAWKQFATHFKEQMPWYNREVFRLVTTIILEAGPNKLVIPVQAVTGGLE